MRVARTRVLPAPAPASTHTGPSVASTASCCASLSPSRYVIHRLYSRSSPHALFRDFPHLALGNRDGLSTQVVVDALCEEAFGRGFPERSEDRLDPSASWRTCEAGMGEVEEAVAVSVSRPTLENLNRGTILDPLSRETHAPVPFCEASTRAPLGLVADD